MSAAATPGAAPASADPAEIHKFDTLAHEFWDPRGAFRFLHVLNPVRLDYIAERVNLAQRRALDIGCGGGLLTEALMRHGAHVTGIDMAPSMIEIARLHAHESQLSIDYELCSAEQYAERGGERFDVITCMELIEHVASPGALFAAITRMLRPGGDLFVSTINRTLRSFLVAIVGAEYLLRLLPRGTHEYARLVRPSELARLARAQGLMACDAVGLEFNPLTRGAHRTRDLGINYLMHLRSPDQAP
jgi:2-polyprenyl-6-hydroxyphenyl methylase/3-demethylubiquinone-9 3-methyltransferase